MLERAYALAADIISAPVAFEKLANGIFASASYRESGMEWLVGLIALFIAIRFWKVSLVLLVIRPPLASAA